MWNTWKNKAMVILMAGMLFLFSAAALMKPRAEYSKSERRTLASLPKFNSETVFSGKFMSEFETYAVDQFPFRDKFRTIKNASALYLFRQSAVHDLYYHKGYISKIEYPINEAMLDNSGEKFKYLYDKYMANTNVNIYFSIVPDKNYFLSKKANSLSLSYDKLVALMREKTAYMKYIDVFPQLNIDNYYYTDTHWKQETILPVAKHLAKGMGTEICEEYKVNKLDGKFYGVYYGQLALPFEADTIHYLTNDILDSCLVTSYNTGKPKAVDMYNLSMSNSKDPYEMFVNGNDALVVIDNPKAKTDKELVLFRDSFGSSIAPLLATGYKKVTLIDIRYINPAMLGSFITFDNQDVLFLYSTILLNNSTSFK